MTARDKGWPTWNKGLGNNEVCVRGGDIVRFPASAEWRFQLTRGNVWFWGYSAWFLAFSLGLLFDQGRKGCLCLLKTRRSRPDRLQVKGKAINSCLLQTVLGQQRKAESKKRRQCQELVLNYSLVYQDSSQAGSTNAGSRSQFLTLRLGHCVQVAQHQQTILWLASPWSVPSAELESNNPVRSSWPLIKTLKVTSDTKVKVTWKSHTSIISFTSTPQNLI